MMNRTRGFSLLEVLVAFVVLAVLGAALSRLFGGALNNIDSANAWGRALEVAQSQLTLASMEMPLRPGTTSGKDGEVKWEVVIEPYVPPADIGETFGVMNLDALQPMKIYRLVATVAFPGMGAERTLSIATTKVTMDPDR